MDMLLTSYATQTGGCLGAAARLFEHLDCDHDKNILSDDIYKHRFMYDGSHIYAPGSYGPGLYLQAKTCFAELCEAKGRLKAMERVQASSSESAVNKLIESITSLAGICSCPDCSDSRQRNELNRPPIPNSASLALSTLSLLSSGFHLKSTFTLTLAPSHSIEA